MLRASIGGIDTELEVLLQFPLDVGVEVVTLEARVEHDTVLVGVVGREGIAAFVSAAIHREFMCLLNGCPEHGILPVSTLTECLDLLVGITTLIAEISLLELCPL